MAKTIKVKRDYDFGSKVTVKKEDMKEYKYAVVEFLSQKDKGLAQGYTYENPIGAKKYDTVIVPTKYGISMAVVVKLTNDLDIHHYYGDVKAIAEVVQSEVVNKEMSVRKKKDLKKKLETEVKKLDEVERFQMYAKNNPAFAELLDEYKSL